MMTRQNRALGFVVFFSILVLGALLWSTGLLRNEKASSEQETSAVSAEAAAGPEAMGDPVGSTESVSVAPSEEQKSFALILSDLDACFGLKSPDPGTEAAVTVDHLLTHLQPDFGPSLRQADRWMSWHLRNREGRERHLRLEVTESDTGVTRRELHYFAVDREGLPIPLELDEDKAQNPSDETINQMLREGNVFYKERAGTIQFPNNERADFVETDGVLSEIEVVRADSIFRCTNLKMREACSCVK